MKIYANLHTHSNHSDGGYSPRDLARTAKAEGYGAVAVTDHDTVTGYAELREECEKLGLETVFGAEFSSPSKLLPAKEGVRTENNSFHICGYGFDPEYPGMKQYLLELGAQKAAQTRQIYDMAVEKGLIRGIEWEEIIALNPGKTWISGSQFFIAMQAKGLLEEKDRSWLSREVFRPLRAKAMPCVFRQEHEIIQLIRDAGGIAVLAHPHEQLQFIEPLMEMGIEGLEACHWLLTEEEQVSALKIGLEKNLYISGGSDHHGWCSGYYERYETPEQCPYYSPALSFGTAKEYFNEIKNKRLSR